MSFMLFLPDMTISVGHANIPYLNGKVFDRQQDKAENRFVEGLFSEMENITFTKKRL